MPFNNLMFLFLKDLNQYSGENNAEKDSAKQDGEPSINERPDTAWSAHLKRNNSFITKLFHGQLMSKLTCAACRKTSYSYDPCAQISLPIPSCKTIFNILLFTRESGSVPLLIKLPVATPNAQVWHLVNMLQAVTKIPAQFISLFNGYTDVCLDDRASIASIEKSKYVIASEVPEDETNVFSLPVFQYLQHPGVFMRCDFCGKTQTEISSKLKRCMRCYVVAYCSRDCQAKHWQVHQKVCSKELKMQIGLPFFITLNKDTLAFDKFEDDLKERANYSVQPCSTSGDDKASSTSSASDANSLEEENKRKSLTLKPNSGCVIKICSKTNVNDEASCTEVNSEHFSVDLLTKASSIILEWQNSPSTSSEEEASNSMCSRDVPIYQSYESEGNLCLDEQCSLYDCLRLFMEPERLDESESWKCPKCKSLQSAKKEMAISSPPCLLLLHLKRFTYGQYGQKINKAVTYPLSNFDLSQFVAKETRSKFDYPLLYDLCGVITHRGTMRMGHYTCMVRMLNQNDEEEIGWRNFDDDCVTKIKNEKVISPDAYVLVYRLHGTQEILKQDKYPLACNYSPTASMENVSLQNVRKRADSVASSGKSPLPERRSASEYTLNRIKRSVSTESANGTGKTSCREESSSPVEMRRCVSAVPMDSCDVTQTLPTGTWSDSLPDIAHMSGNTAHEFSPGSGGRNASPTFGSELSCDSFEHPNINESDTVNVPNDVVWINSSDKLEDTSIYGGSDNTTLDSESIDENDLD